MFTSNTIKPRFQFTHAHYNTPSISVRGDLDVHVYTHWNVVRCICKALAESLRVFRGHIIKHNLSSKRWGILKNETLAYNKFFSLFKRLTSF
jgi:hypothetical protein